MELAPRPCPLPVSVAIAAVLALPGAHSAQVGAIGLSPYRAQSFANENILINVPADFEHFGAALAVGDFNGDGADDLATGVPNDTGIPSLEVPGAGAVVVRYGSPGQGLQTSAATNVLGQHGESNPDPADEGDHFGFSLAACDFNRDGFDDLAVGIPDEDHGSEDAGAVQIHYGTAAGLPANGDDFYAQSTAGVPGDAEEGDHFGFALACGDFDADTFADLAIGVPFETREANLQHVEVPFHGMVDVIPGSAQGLNPSAAYGLDQNSDGMDGGIDTNDHFGAALAAGQFDGGSHADLAVGIPGESFLDDNENDTHEGAVQVVFGGPSGATGSANIMFSGNAFVGAQVLARFGTRLAAGDFDGDRKDDLAVGIPLHDVNSGGLKEDAGEVAVVYGAGGIGLDFSRGEIWTQQDVLGPGADAAGDRFGDALAAGDFDRDGVEDLAIGHPREAVGAQATGATTVMMGTLGGLSPTRHRRLVPGLDLFPGDLASGQRFGAALASGDFDGDGHRDLAIGAPHHAVGEAAEAGEEVVLYGSIHSDGFELGLDPVWLTSASAPAAAGVSGIRFAGPLGLAVSAAPGHTAYVRHDIPTGIASYRARFYARLWPLAIQPGRFFVLLQGDDGTQPVFRLYVNRDGQENGVTVGVFDDLGEEIFAPLLIPLPDGWRAIEMNWRAGNPGSLTLWVDGHFHDLLQGLDNGQTRLRSVRLGAVDLLGASTAGTFYLDEYVATRFTRAGELASFREAQLGSALWPTYQALFNAEITAGCKAGTYCPELPVTREQFAMFLLASKDGPSFTPAPCATRPFADVPVESPFCPWIRELGSRGITAGCGGGNFCPAQAVTRRVAAVLLQRTREGAGEPPGVCADNPFPDVPPDDFCGYVRYLADNGITAGCGGGMFCPFDPLRRDQLAPLLIETFDLFVPVP